MAGPRTVERWMQRDAKRRQRELTQHLKEQAKLSALEQARLEVEAFENSVEVLISFHKETPEPCDWSTFASSLPPVPPVRQRYNELRMKQRQAVAVPLIDVESDLEQAKQADENAYQAALQAHSKELADWEQSRNTARRVLAGDMDAYAEVLREHNPFAELADIGSSLNFAFHSARLLGCTLSVHGSTAIPTEVKSLTTSGRLSVKTMPKARFAEIYQDYVCSCILRVAREAFALLPVSNVILTATLEVTDTRTGLPVERPVVSVICPRDILATFDFDKLDPSDAIMGLQHRGDIMLSRKTGEIEAIKPLIPDDLPHAEARPGGGNRDFLAEARHLRSQLGTEREGMRSAAVDAPSNGDAK